MIKAGNIPSANERNIHELVVEIRFRTIIRFQMSEQHFRVVDEILDIGICQGIIGIVVFEGDKKQVVAHDLSIVEKLSRRSRFCDVLYDVIIGLFNLLNHKLLGRQTVVTHRIMRHFLKGRIRRNVFFNIQLKVCDISGMNIPVRIQALRGVTVRKKSASIIDTIETV